MRPCAYPRSRPGWRRRQEGDQGKTFTFPDRYRFMVGLLRADSDLGCVHYRPGYEPQTLVAYRLSPNQDFALQINLRWTDTEATVKASVLHPGEPENDGDLQASIPLGKWVVKIEDLDHGMELVTEGVIRNIDMAIVTVARDCMGFYRST
jgi:hypothetical protein